MYPSEFSIVALTHAHQPAWLELRAQMWPDIARHDHADEIAHMLAEPARWAAFGALTPDEQLVGLLEVSLREFGEEAISEPTGYLESWFVRGDWRRRGVGRALVAAGENWARAHRCRRMASDTELVNAASRAAHARIGYQETAQLIRFSKLLV